MCKVEKHPLALLLSAKNCLSFMGMYECLVIDTNWNWFPCSQEQVELHLPTLQASPAFGKCSACMMGNVDCYWKQVRPWINQENDWLRRILSQSNLGTVETRLVKEAKKSIPIRVQVTTWAILCIFCLHNSLVFCYYKSYFFFKKKISTMYSTTVLWASTWCLALYPVFFTIALFIKRQQILCKHF